MILADTYQDVLPGMDTSRYEPGLGPKGSSGISREHAAEIYDRWISDPESRHARMMRMAEQLGRNATPADVRVAYERSTEDNRISIGHETYLASYAISIRAALDGMEIVR